MGNTFTVRRALRRRVQVQFRARKRQSPWELNHSSILSLPLHPKNFIVRYVAQTTYAEGVQRT